MGLRSVAILFALICFQLTTMAAPWRGIIPLRSTMSDVRANLGQPTEHGYYQVDEGRVRIFYGADDPTAMTCWGRIGKDVVASISVTLDVPRKLKNRKGLRLTKDSHHPEIGTYTDWEKGIQYEVSLEDHEISKVTYLPSKKDCDEILIAF